MTDTTYVSPTMYGPEPLASELTISATLKGLLAKRLWNGILTANDVGYLEGIRDVWKTRPSDGTDDLVPEVNALIDALQHAKCGLDLRFDDENREAYAAGFRDGRAAGGTRKRRVMSDGLLASVAAVYRTAYGNGVPPTRAVGDHFKVSHRTATRWVSEARKIGALGRAIGTRAGEMSTESE